MRVWLVRHASTTAVPGITIGAGDPPLSEEGRAQARRLAASLGERPLSRIWASDLTRAVETAVIIAAPHRLSVQTTPALRELDFGMWEGRALSELWRDDRDAALAWEADITDTPATFGESVRQLEVRVREFWSRVELAAEVACVAHRGSLACLQSVITGQPFAECFRSSAPWVETFPR
ncbi:MAG TPA: histidine phosphatase family protein [Candidatus Dormibacteraeota bacterium]|nr:histidine phosphatase family protein [Candidatus Dormibacteraeota bacterium]